MHVRDNAQRPITRGTREHKLCQIIPLEERLNATFQMHYNCGKNVTVDERIIPSKCKLNPCRVYNPKKPHKFGIQLWNLCNSATRYNYSFRVYDKLPCPELDFHVVAMLVKDLKQKGHHIFFDRWFTSIKILMDLTTEGHRGTGTYMSNIKYFPAQGMCVLSRVQGAHQDLHMMTEKVLLHVVGWIRNPFCLLLMYMV